MYRELPGGGGDGDGSGIDLSNYTTLPAFQAHTESPHNTDATARASAVTNAAGITANETAIEEIRNAQAVVVQLGAYDNLTDAEKAAVTLGQITIRYGRFWGVGNVNQARANGPLDVPNHGWSALSGQNRGLAPTATRTYDIGDHTIVGAEPDHW